MISERDLCPDDPVAPGLLAAFDSARLTASIRAAKPGWRVESARVVRSKYKPYSKGLLTVSMACASEPGTFLALRLLPPDKVADQFERALSASASPQLVFTLADINAVAWAFPADYRMPQLANLVDRAKQASLVIPELAGLIADEGRIVDWTSEVVQYAPEQSCTIRLTAILESPEGERRRRTFYGKHHAAGEAGDAAAALAAIEDARGRTPVAFATAPIILDQPRLGLQWQAPAHGQQVSLDALLDPADPALRRVAGAVASLHAIPASLTQRSARECDARLDARLKVAGCLDRESRNAIAESIRTLARTQPAPASRLRLCHGDLHPKNLFISDEQITFIDFDTACMAPPEQDVASFCAALIYHGAIAGLSDAEIDTAVRRWTDAYVSAGGQLDAGRLAWLTAFCLIDERLYRCLTRLKPGRRAIAQRLVARVAATTSNLRADSSLAHAR